MQDVLSEIADNLFGAMTGECASGHPALPSFLYKGNGFDATRWDREVRQLSANALREKYEITYTSPDRLLKLRLTYRVYSDYPVIAFQPELLPATGSDTGIIDTFKSMSIIVPLPEGIEPSLVLRRKLGCKNRRDDFEERNVTLTDRYPEDRIRLDCDQAFSSATWLPYFSLDLDEDFGFTVGIGWSGAWQADIGIGGGKLSFSAGMGATHFRIHPGESIRQPSIFILLRDGMDKEEADAMLAQFMQDFHSPRDEDGVPLPSPSAITMSGTAKDSEIVAKLSSLKQGEIEVLRLTDGWNGPDRAEAREGVPGDWSVNRGIHPEGLTPVSVKAYEHGMKFMLDCDLERVAPNTPIALEHPEWLLRKGESKDAYLLNLGRHEAREAAVEIIRNLIDEEGLDCLMHLCSLDPMPFLACDNEDRQGITEAKYVDGLYKFWDALRKAYPNMLICNDNDGRRLDFEARSRAVQLLK